MPPRDSRFLPAPPPMRLAEVAELVGAGVLRGDPERVICGAAALSDAGPAQIAFLDNPKYADAVGQTRAGAVICQARFADRVPADAAVLKAKSPQETFTRYLIAAYPAALKPSTAGDGRGTSAFVDPSALIEDGVAIGPGAVVGARAEIGRGTSIGAGAVIGDGVAIGRDCAVGPQATIQFALIGNRVIVHPGARIGQDGFGFALSPAGHMKVPQIGRVIIQDDCEIGANTTIDRGSLRDTVIGEGTKIDNLVQIGHNVEIGRHCVIVSQVGISGSVRIGDFVALGGKVGIAGHVEIGSGTQVAARSGVVSDIPAGVQYAGFPAIPARQWAREVATLHRLVKRRQPD